MSTSDDNAGRPPRRRGAGATLQLDCDRCPVRGTGCDDCAIGVLLSMAPTHLVPDVAERAALELLVRSGLVDPQDAARAQVTAGGRRTGHVA